MNRLFLLISVMTCVSVCANSQTYLGKRFFAFAGIGVSPFIDKGSQLDEIGYCKYETPMFPFKGGVEAGWALNRALTFSVSGDWKPLRNSSLSVMGSSYTTNGNSVYLNYEDDHFIRSDAWQVGLNMRLFFLHAPVGPYFRFGADYYLLKSTAYSTLTQSTNNQFYYVERRLEPWKANSGVVGIHFGLGKTELIGYHMLMDAGFRFNVTFSKSEGTTSYVPSGTETYFDFENQGGELIRPLVASNLFSSNLLEFYVKIGYIR